MYFRIGVRAHDYGRKSPAQLASDIKEAGFCSVQLAISKAIAGMEEDTGRLTPGLAFTIGEAFRERGVNIAVLGCYIEPVHPDDALRELHLKRFKEHLLYAPAMGGLVVGTETTLYRAQEPGAESGREKAFQTLLRSIEVMLEAAQKSGAVVGIEPVAAHTLNSPDITARMLETFKSEHLKIIFDPVNLLTPKTAANHDALLDEAFGAFGEHIVALHCKDVIVGEDGRLRDVPLGQGLLNYPKIIAYLKKQRPGLALLREGAKPETAAADIAFLSNLSA